MTSDEIYQRIIVMDSIKSANTFMKTSDISKSDLSKLCKKYSLFVPEKATKEDIISIFINSTLGVKLRKKANNKHSSK